MTDRDWIDWQNTIITDYRASRVKRNTAIEKLRKENDESRQQLDDAQASALQEAKELLVEVKTIGGRNKQRLPERESIVAIHAVDTELTPIEQFRHYAAWCRKAGRTLSGRGRFSCLPAGLLIGAFLCTAAGLCYALMASLLGGPSDGDGSGLARFAGITTAATVLTTSILLLYYSRDIARLQRAAQLIGVIFHNAQALYDSIARRIKERYDSQIKQIDAAYEQKESLVQERHAAEVAPIRQEVADFRTALESSFPSWQTEVDSHAVSARTSLNMTPVGEVCLDDADLSTPFLLRFPDDRPLVLRIESGVAREGIVVGLQAFLLRLLTSIAPGRLLFTFVDPVGRGQNVSAFMHLRDHDDTLINARPWTRTEHIERKLDDLIEHVEMVIQNRLRNQYRTINDYNQEAGEIAVPYHVLVAFDFPTNFSDSALQYLVSIVRNGPRCGVHTILVIDPHTPLPHGFDLQTVEENAIVLHGSEVGVVLRDDDYPSCTIQMATPPTGRRFDQILKKIGQGALAASCVQVPFARITPEASKWWTASAESGLRVAVGTTGARSLQRLDLGSGTAQHVLVAGKTGAGKSTMLHVLITNLALTYSPWEVQLYLVDFKKGVEFKAYASARNWILPHARVVAIESEREFGLSVLKALDEELKTRGDAFRKAGVDSLAAYRQRTEQHLPRLLLIVDEFQEFFAEDDKVSAESKLILDRLIRQGRAFGMHVLLGSQTLAGAYALSRSTTDQMAVRIALQCSDIDSRLILADDNPAARRLSRPGEAIYNDANGFLEGNSLFQVAWLPDDERGHYLAGVQKLVKQHGYSTEAKPIVFEGGKRVTLVDNSSMARLLARPSWPPPSDARVAWVGEPVAIRPPVHIPFAREAGRNVLVVGQDMESALGMFASAILSLAAQHAPDAAAFQLFDYSPLNADHDDLFARLMHALPHDSICARRRDVELSVAKIADEVNRRLDMEEAALQKTPPWYLFVFGIQAARELRAADQYGLSSFRPLDEQPPSAGAQFLRILQEGPALGIHTVIWADNCHNLNRIVDRRNMHEFGLRVTMQMSPEDSSLIIDSTAASKLGLHRALLYFEGAGGLEKFLPYEAPDDRWVQWVGARLRAKAGR